MELNQNRLDFAISALLPKYSRSRIQEWIKSGYITVDGKILRSKDKIHTDQIININATVTTATESKPQPIALNVTYEDSDIIVIDKPVGLVVHPGAGQPEGTLLNALLYRYPELINVPRAGIIHRLDKDTSGLLVITRNLTSHTKLVSELQNRRINREYEAIINGSMISGGTIKAPIGRHLFKRTLMSVKENGKYATTHYRIIKRFSAHTHLRIILETGRTHQIRVHLAHIGYPIVGDQVYGRGIRIPANCNELLRNTLMQFKHQALHACRLGLTHPRTDKLMEWKTKLPKDFKILLEALI